MNSRRVAEPTQPISIFLCYAHEDEALREGLEKQLRALRRQGLIDIWHDRDIRAGAEWEHEINHHLNVADIILLLISPDFMDSEYCYGIEMERAMQRHERGETCVIPIILRHVHWQSAPFGKLQALPTDAKPIEDRFWYSKDEAFFKAAEGIRLSVEKLLIRKADEERARKADEERARKADEERARKAEKAAQELLEAIKNNQTETLSFWQDALYTIAPYTNSSKTDVWLDLLLDLCQVMHVPAYQQWWQGQGKAAAHSLRSLADKAPQSKTATKLSNCARNIAGTLFSRIADKAYKPKSIRHIQLLLEILIVVTPVDNTNIWPDLLQKLSSTIHGRIDETHSWELRSLLLQTWANIAILEKNPFILRRWLEVHWHELDKLLSLKLPDNWYKVSIAKVLLSAHSDFARVDLIGTVTGHSRLFEEVLEQFMKDPATQQTTMYFFALLAERHYSRIFPLLDRLFATCHYHKDVIETLLASLDLQSSQEIANLLENYCKILLSEHELTPSLVSIIEQYLSSFDPEYLDNHPTRELLLRLLKRSKIPALGLPSDLHKVVEGWYRIAKFIKSPDVERDQLRDLSLSTRSMTQLTPDARSKLAAKLLPCLVESVSTEMDLVRVISNLSKVLVEKVQGDTNLDLLLLEQMAKIAGEKYGQERPPVRVAPYIKVVLGESHFLPPAEKEAFVDGCLRALLKQVDTEISNNFTINLTLWPDHIVTEWKAYLSRSSRTVITEALTRFRSAIQHTEMLVIVQTYDPLLKGYLQPQERQLLELARKFVAAYQADDDATLVEVNDTINKSPYSKQLGYTHAQRERIKLAQSHMSTISQPIAPNVHARIPAPPPQHLPQETPVSRGPSIAVVKGQLITLEWFERVLELKGPYTEFRINWLLEQIQALEQTDFYDRNVKEQRYMIKTELKGLNKILGHPKQLREATLDNLVNDILIREEISKLISQDPANRRQWFDIEADLSEILDHLRIQQGHSYSFLISDDPNKILEILRIFRRHELFATYLHWHDRILQQWLKEQRTREKANITINYALAGVKEPTKLGSRWPSWLL